MPLHAELRAAYWFGSGAHLDQVFQPFIQLSGGAAQVDASLDTEVIDLSGGRTCVPTVNPVTGSSVTTCRVPVQAWRKTGTFFVGAGLGGAIAFTKDVGLVLEARFMQLLPASGSALGLGGGLQVGF
jgi:hypothetical protein